MLDTTRQPSERKYYVSVSRETYDRLTAYARERGLSKAQALMSMLKLEASG